MMKRLEIIFAKIRHGESLSNAHWAHKTLENARKMYGFAEYLRDLI